jgi:hypothetical protein
MTTGVCSRCGRSGEMDYGSDGLMYCSSCSFYGLNKQCWKCRMYLPAAELQQYRGQWMCPYCVQDSRDKDRKAEEYVPKKPHLDIISYPEQCDRCGRDLEGLVYIWNGRKLCKHCVQDEQEKWGLVGGGPMSAPYRINLGPEKRRKKTSIIESIISELLHLLGIRKKKQMEVVVVGGKMPIGLAKPMAEEMMAGGRKEKDERRPQSEGIMRAKRQPAGPAEEGEGAPPAAPAGGELSLVVPAKSGKSMKKRRGGTGGPKKAEKKKKQ